MRSLIAVFLLFCSPALAASDLEERIVAELLAAQRSAVPADGRIRIVSMTPVRGHVERIDVDRYDPRSGYFSAIVANGSVQRQITGRAMTEVPTVVTRRFVREGETVDQGALAIEFIPLPRLPPNAARTLAAVTGLEARRSLVSGAPVSMDHIGKPAVIGRSETVLLSYESAHLRLTAKGRAMSDGAEGDMIPVMPQGGNQIVEGTVIGPGHVSVGGGI